MRERERERERENKDFTTNTKTRVKSEFLDFLLVRIVDRIIIGFNLKNTKSLCILVTGRDSEKR